MFRTVRLSAEDYTWKLKDMTKAVDLETNLG